MKLQKICIFFFSHFCLLSLHSQENISEYYKSCLEVFQDEVKCKKMFTKKDSNLKPEQEKKEKFYLREELKKLLYSKNKIFVKNLLSEPTEIYFEPSGKEIFIYKTKISKKEESSEFDQEIRIFFFKGLVNRIQFFSNSESGFHLLKPKSKGEIQ